MYNLTTNIHGKGMGYIELTKLMWALIKQLGSQSKLAKALHQSKQQVSYWLNGDRKPRYEHILAMQKLLQKLEEVSRLKQHHASIEYIVADNANHIELSGINNKQLKISERIELAIHLEKQITSKHSIKNNKSLITNKTISLDPPSFNQNTPSLTTSKNQSKTPKPNSHSSFKNCTHQLIIKNLGFSKTSFYHGKIVLTKGIPELVHIMNHKLIGIGTAALIAKLSKEIQTNLLKKDIKEILFFLKKQSTQKQKSAKPLSNQDIFIQKNLSLPTEVKLIDIRKIQKNTQLKILEEKLKLPVRTIFLGLLIECNEHGIFIFNSLILKKKIMPYIDFNFEEFMHELCICKIIKKLEGPSPFHYQVLDTSFTDFKNF